MAALQAQNIQIPGGKVEQGVRDLTLRTYGRVGFPADFGDIPIANVGGTAIRAWPAKAGVCWSSGARCKPMLPRSHKAPI